MRPVWTGHPWVFAQAVARVEGGARAGDEVVVYDPHGNALGRGFYSPSSAIAVRLLTHDPDLSLDGAFFRAAFVRALARRRALHLPNADTDAYRLVHSEGDGLPGLTVDVFGSTCVVQATTLGMHLRRALWLEALHETLGPRVVIDRTPAEAGRREGFAPSPGVIRGDEGATTLAFRERGFRFSLPPDLGQKTGFYFDQRPLRTRVEQLASGRRVLDAFTYVGTFALAAARGGAVEVVAVDSSAVAVEVGAVTARENGLAEKVSFRRGDAHEALARAGREGGYDLVLCDPPKLAPSGRVRDEALAAYRKLASLGASATRPGGVLVVCSCSAAIGLDALTRALALGARDVGARATVLERHFQGADHPVPAAFPEGLYLKSLIAVVEPFAAAR